MSKKDELMRRLMGVPEPQQATEGTEGGSEAVASPPASQSTEGGSEAETKPPSMNEILRSQSKRRIDIFGQTPQTEGTEPPTTEDIERPLTMSELIRLQARGRYVIPAAPAEEPDEQR